MAHHQPAGRHGLEARRVRLLHREGDRLDPGHLGQPLRRRRHLPLLDRQAHDHGHGDLPGHALPGRVQVRPGHRLRPRGAGGCGHRSRAVTSTPTRATRAASRSAARRRRAASSARPRASSNWRSTRRASTARTSWRATGTPDGDLWVCSMRHAGVVYPPDSPIVARGKKVTVPGSKYVDRGETNFEGYVDEPGDKPPGPHQLPLEPGRRAADRQRGPGRQQDRAGADSTSTRTSPITYDAQVAGHGREQRAHADLQRLLAAPVPGVHHGLGLLLRRARRGRASCRASWWRRTARARPTGPPAPTASAGRSTPRATAIMPGDIYRLIGGVVVRKRGEAPALCRLHGERLPAAQGVQQQPGDRGRAPRTCSAPPARRRASSWWACGPAWSTRPAPRSRRRVQIDPILPANDQLHARSTPTAAASTPRARATVSAPSPARTAGRWTSPASTATSLPPTGRGTSAIMPGLPGHRRRVLRHREGPPGRRGGPGAGPAAAV